MLPPGAVGTVVGGQAVTRQDQYGYVYTSASSSPIFVRVNAGKVRLKGVEAAGAARLSAALTLSANVSSILGTDLATGLPPNLENGIPPTHGFVGLRYQPVGARWWAEAYSHFAATQDRFSSNDLSQARIGGNRTKSEITNFFNNGAVARGLVKNGILVATGEALSQVLTRVLGPDINATVPFMTENPGYATFNLRGGVDFSRHARLAVLVENVFDRNYRLMGSGIDGPGRTVLVRQSVLF
jgi:outer membrane receptor protein involved in Fe transport